MEYAVASQGKIDKLYRDWLKGMQIWLGNSQTGSGTNVMYELNRKPLKARYYKPFSDPVFRPPLLAYSLLRLSRSANAYQRSTLAPSGETRGFGVGGGCQGIDHEPHAAVARPLPPSFFEWANAVTDDGQTD